MNPVTVINGNPRILYRAIAEFAYSDFFRYGRIIAAIAVPKNVTAITSVASRMYVENLAVYAYNAPTAIDGTSISTNAHTGTCRFFGDVGDLLGQHPVERGREDHARRRQEQRPRPPEEPRAEARAR